MMEKAGNGDRRPREGGPMAGDLMETAQDANPNRTIM